MRCSDAKLRLSPLQEKGKKDHLLSLWLKTSLGRWAGFLNPIDFMVTVADFVNAPKNLLLPYWHLIFGYIKNLFDLPVNKFFLKNQIIFIKANSIIKK